MKEEGFHQFVTREKKWLEDYALYMVIKDIHEAKAWNQWPKNLKSAHLKQ